MVKLECLSFLLFAYYIPEANGSIRVCKSYKDFAVPWSKNCWRNDYDVLDSSAIARTWGFHTENYTLTLEDGYIITVIRVYKERNRKHPIVLGHGAFTNSICWLFSGNNSLAYVLGYLGYDVWMVNFRGTRYSKEHVSLTYRSHEYWKFTFHDIGIHDLKATMELVRNVTDKKAIYLGYSMGTTSGYVYCSMTPEHCDKTMLGMLSFAPVGYLIGIKGVFSIVANRSVWPLARALTYLFFNGEFTKLTLVNKLIYKFLSLTAVGNYAAIFLVNFVFGFHFTALDPTYIPVVINRFQDTVGVEVISHHSQNYNNKNFRQFDYGKKKNLEIYSQEQPPAYPLHKIPIPIAMFVGKGDFIATEKSGSRLYSQLGSRCGYYILEERSWCHNDFVTAKNIREVLYGKVINKISEMENGECA
ncbi:lipase 1-like [Cylas formicarius]|uniref:lipase 1-like n=1 Tax=Cylas formicarius TaxID=197179 RepID=UPI0029588403|nr:lipase 1-like [Cylas formicarius]